MKAFIIGDINNPISTVAMRRLINSIKSTESKIDYQIFRATTPDTLGEDKEELYGSVANSIAWTWPTSDNPGKVFDVNFNLIQHPYKTSDFRKVQACFLSHARLWKLVGEPGNEEPIMILEHDALFTNTFNWDKLKDKFTGGILGLNNPMRATRKASEFHNSVVREAQKSRGRVVMECPWVDKDRQIPQGLAGNSAYIIKPLAGRKLIKLSARVGMWPNDALMCKQLYPNLQVVYPYYTKVQGIQSTTTS